METGVHPPPKRMVRCKKGNYSPKTVFFAKKQCFGAIFQWIFLKGKGEYPHLNGQSVPENLMGKS